MCVASARRKTGRNDWVVEQTEEAHEIGDIVIRLHNNSLHAATAVIVPLRDYCYYY